MNPAAPSSSALVRHWRSRARFSDRRSWLVDLYNRVLRRFPSMPLPGRRSVRAVRLAGHRDPFHVRLGTTDLLVLDEMFVSGEYRFVQSCLEGVQRVVDLGANAGFSLRFWNEVLPSAHLTAVEPDPSNLGLARLNVEAAGFGDRVTFVQACVGARSRRVRLQGTDEWAYQMVDCSGGQAGETQVVTMAEVLDMQTGGGRIGLLKCDIEGAEQELFGDCGSWISRVDSIVIELHPPYTKALFLADLIRGDGDFEVVAELGGKQFPVLLLRRTKVTSESASRPVSTRELQGTSIFDTRP